MKNWRGVTADAPCPACRKSDGCRWAADGWLTCWRSIDPPDGFTRVKIVGGGAIFRPLKSRGNNSRDAAGPTANQTRGASGTRLDWTAESERFASVLSPDKCGELAKTLGVSADALATLGAGWAGDDELRRIHASGAEWQENYPDGAFTFPERDGGGRIVGLSLRTADGRKGAPSGKLGAKRGLIVPRTLRERSDPVLIVEGASDVAACETLGLAAVGRPSNTGGADHLARLLEGRDVLIVGENDTKESGAWPGRDGADRVAGRLATEWEKPVGWTLPPDGMKDARAWLQARSAAGLDLMDGEACKAAGAELLDGLRAKTIEAKAERKPPQSERLVRLAQEIYRIGISDRDEPFAVRHDGPNVALLFRGSRDALRSALSREYRRRHGTTPNAAALADALTALQGEAQDCAPEPVHLRIAEHDDAIVLDLGGADGRAVVIRADGWHVADVSPVLFRRTALTGELPEPQTGGNLAMLRELVNVTHASWPLVLGWLVAAMLPELPHPVLMLGGEQGTGKSTATRYLVGVFDPSAALLRSQPSEPRQWVISASGSWAVATDNVSIIPRWWSDALCKAVTGDGWIDRRLYTDSELTVLSFRRVLILTSIDAGALRGDLGDRLLLVELERISEAQRRSETELDELYELRGPLILGALLDLVSAVLARLPHLTLPGMPRMADFARVLAAMDDAIGTDALPRYLAQGERIAGDVIEADPVGVAIVALAESVDEWTGTASELLAKLTPTNPPKDWPKSAPALGGRLKRLTPALRKVGVEVEQTRDTDRARTRRVSIRKGREPSVRSVRPSGDSESN